MTLYVYITLKPVNQHRKFTNTYIQTCNAESPRGFQLANSFANVFEAEPDGLFNEGKIKGYMHYSRFLRIYMEFESLNHFIYFAEKELYNERVQLPYKRFDWIFWIAVGYIATWAIQYIIK